jgi:hypothetical protein
MKNKISFYEFYFDNIYSWQNFRYSYYRDEKCQNKKKHFIYFNGEFALNFITICTNDVKGGFYFFGKYYFGL